MKKVRKALDLFCGAGGATRGLQAAGFHVTGVDIKWHPRYCGDAFIQMDALAAVVERYDFIWASPPCQAHTAMKTMHNAKPHEDLIPQTRRLLQESGRPYVIENVEGAQLIDPILLCGTMFELGAGGAELRRHRLFECSLPMMVPPCRHTKPTIGVYGGHVRNRQRVEGSKDRGTTDWPKELGEEAMQIDWMTLTELSQAIPPAYSHYIGAQVMSYLLGEERVA